MSDPIHEIVAQSKNECLSIVVHARGTSMDISFLKLLEW